MNPEDPNNPISGLLGDLLKVIGGGARGTAAPWLDAARALAQGVATDGEPETNVDPIQRIKLEELARVVELHVEGTTGLSIGDGQTYSFVPVGRAAWANRALDGWRPMLQRMVDAIETAPTPPLDAAFGPDDLPDGLQALLGQFASTMGPIMLGLQFGSAAGHLARQALGQYALIVPWPRSSELLVVPENVAAFAADWSLPEDATLLWVCAHELTVQLVLDRPHITARLNELLEAAVVESMAAQQGITERLTGGGDSLESLMSDPEALLADLLTPGARATSERLNALVAALSGYIDHATAAIAQAITGSAGPLSEAWYRYRTSDSRGRQAAAALFGFDVSRAQVDRGAAFVRGVVERAGEDGLGRLVLDVRALPTPAEVDAPGLWLERIDLPEQPTEDAAE
jgi:putative hydrolase